MSGTSAFDPECIFCKINAEDPYNQIEWRSRTQGRSSVFTPRNPVDKHRLIVPQRHTATAIEDAVTLGETLMDVVEYAYEHSLKRYILVFNVGRDATQTVFHTHGHILPRGILDPIELPWKRRLRTELLYLLGLKVCTLCKITAGRPGGRAENADRWNGRASIAIKPQGAISDKHWIVAVRGSHPIGEAGRRAMLYMMAQDIVDFANERNMKALNLIYVSRSLTSDIQHPLIHVIEREKGDGIILPWTHQIVH